MSYEVLARPLRVAILTVSDTRTFETDKGGNKVQEFLEQANHIVADRKIVIDDYDEIRNAMIPWCMMNLLMLSSLQVARELQSAM